MSNFATYPSLKGRKILVTGGATGIGAAFVEQFHAQGSVVAFLDIDKGSGGSLELKLGSNTHFRVCDLTKADEIKSAVDWANAAMEGIDVLINNAANDRRHSFLETSEADWESLIAINVKHQFFAAQAVIPIMKRQNSGVILNVSSGCFLLGTFVRYPVYMVAKSGIMGLTQTLAREFGEFNIRVNAIIPGWIMTEKQIKEHLNEESEAQLLQDQCLKEKVGPEDVARLALFLAADDSRMITKNKFHVDAGWINGI